MPRDEEFDEDDFADDDEFVNEEEEDDTPPVNLASVPAFSPAARTLAAKAAAAKAQGQGAQGKGKGKGGKGVSTYSGSGDGAPANTAQLQNNVRQLLGTTAGGGVGGKGGGNGNVGNADGGSVRSGPPPPSGENAEGQGQPVVKGKGKGKGKLGAQVKSKYMNPPTNHAAAGEENNESQGASSSWWSVLTGAEPAKAKPKPLSFDEWKRRKGIPAGTKVFMVGKPAAKKFAGVPKAKAKAGLNAGLSSTGQPLQQGGTTTSTTGTTGPKPNKLEGLEWEEGEENKQSGNCSTDSNGSTSSSGTSGTSSSNGCVAKKDDTGFGTPGSEVAVGGPSAILRAYFLKKGYVENTERLSPHFDYKFSFAKGTYNMNGRFADDLYKRHLPHQVLAYYNSCFCLTTKSGLAMTLRATSGTVHPTYQQGLILESYNVSFAKGVENFINQYRRQHCRALIFKWSGAGVEGKAEKIGGKGREVLTNQLRLAMSYVLAGVKTSIVTENHWQILQQPTDDPTGAGTAAGSVNENQDKQSLLELLKVLQTIKMKLRDPSLGCQWTALDGPENVWIAKPTAMARGIGVEVCPDSLEETLLDYANFIPRNCLNPKSKRPPGSEPSGEFPEMLKIPLNTQNVAKRRFVLQKYVERPMMVRRRKFHIRQWVAVTSFKPGFVRAWFYLDAYMSLAGREYELDEEPNANNNANNPVKGAMTPVTPIGRTLTKEEIAKQEKEKKEKEWRHRFRHLTNIYIVKQADGDKFDSHDSMWHSNRFIKYLEEEKERWEKGVSSVGRATSRDGSNGSSGSSDEPKPPTWSSIQEQMQRLVWISLQASTCAAHQGLASGPNRWRSIHDRDNSFQIFGYDFLVDYEGIVWLIEVNSTPDLNPTTETTRDLVGKMLPNLAEVVIEEEKFGHERIGWNNKVGSTGNAGKEKDVGTGSVDGNSNANTNGNTNNAGSFNANSNGNTNNSGSFEFAPGDRTKGPVIPPTPIGIPGYQPPKKIGKEVCPKMHQFQMSTVNGRFQLMTTPPSSSSTSSNASTTGSASGSSATGSSAASSSASISNVTPPGSSNSSVSGSAPVTATKAKPQSQTSQTIVQTPASKPAPKRQPTTTTTTTSSPSPNNTSSLLPKSTSIGGMVASTAGTTTNSKGTATASASAPTDTAATTQQQSPIVSFYSDMPDTEEKSSNSRKSRVRRLIPGYYQKFWKP